MEEKGVEGWEREQHKSEASIFTNYFRHQLGQMVVVVVVMEEVVKLMFEEEDKEREREGTK